MLDLQIVFPVHNEEESIEAVLSEWHDFLEIPHQFIVCEDGSGDDTVGAVARASERLPIVLLSSPSRKGYSRAVLDGLQASSASYVLCVDSDGQCDPRDFPTLWANRHNSDVTKGWRVHRADPAVRRVLSGLFRMYYRALFLIPVKDPSCPYVLMNRKVIDQLTPELGELEQGFWWEFIARAHRRGFTVAELPIHHRVRSHGVTQVYRWRKMPSIGIRHVIGLGRIWWQTRR